MNTIQMNSSKYSEKRDELIGIMNDLIDMEEISAERANEFKRIRKKCLENQFNIVLIGEFQGGKSTTFNAFCGGREISPRGAMIKTSACPITATNISDPNAEEFALVQWKTEAELLMNMQDILNKYISPEDTDYDKESKEVFELYKYMKLSNPVHRKLIKEALENEWEEIRNEPAGHRNQMDICRISDIILTFYNDPIIESIQKKNIIDIGRGEQRTKCTIEEVSRLAVFPSDWETRSAGGAKAFDANEVFFAFIAGIDCYIHSKNLERLGCSITDCPGLFTSAWDTQVAFNTLPKADAVIYLLGGEKQMSESDTHALSYIKKLSTIEDKLFFAVNQKKKGRVTEKILQEDKSIIESLGFNNVDIHLFNVQLFFLSEYGMAYLEDRLDEYSKKRFPIVANQFDISENNLENYWNKSCNEALHMVSTDDGVVVNGLNQENIEKILAQSRAPQVFDEIETFIVDKKAYSILIQSGANVVVKSLTELEGELTRQEEDVLKDISKCEAEFEAAQNALDKFQVEAKTIISEAFPKEICTLIVSQAYDKIIRNEDVIASLSWQASRDLFPVLSFKCRALGLQLTMYERFATPENTAAVKEKLRAILEPAIKSSVTEVLGGNIREWVTNVIQGDDMDYKLTMLPKLNELSKKLKEKWELCVEQNPPIAAFELPNIPQSYKEIIESIPESLDGINVDPDEIVDQAKDVAVKALLDAIITQLVSVIIAAISLLIVDSFLTFGLATIVAGIIYLLSIIIRSDGAKERAVRKLQTKIYPVLTELLNKNDTIQTIKAGLMNLPDKVIEGYTIYYNKLLSDQKVNLEMDVKKRRENKQHSLEKQQEIAEYAKNMRETKIIPMRQRVEEFVRSCENAVP